MLIKVVKQGVLYWEGFCYDVGTLSIRDMTAYLLALRVCNHGGKVEKGTWLVEDISYTTRLKE